MGEEIAQSALEEIISGEFKGEDGFFYKINKTFIDSGYDTGDVYAFCRLFNRKKVVPIKGVDVQNFPVSAPVKAELRKSGRKMSSHGLFFYKIGTSLLKKRIYSTFNLPDESYRDDKTWRKIYYPKSYEQEWFEQLCSEQLITVRNKTTNHAKQVWKQKRDRNEALDLAVYNLAAAHLLKLEEKDIALKRSDKKGPSKSSPGAKKPKSKPKFEIGL